MMYFLYESFSQLSLNNNVKFVKNTTVAVVDRKLIGSSD